MRRQLLLFRYTNSSSSTSSGLGVLSTHSETPVVTQSPVSSDLLQSLQILTQFVIESIGYHLQHSRSISICVHKYIIHWDIIHQHK